MNRYTASALLCFVLVLSNSLAATLDVGAGYPFASIRAAAALAQPGDTILVHGGTYPGGEFITGLRGTPEAWIHITAVAGETAVFEGGNEALHLSDAAYVHISGLTFQRQKANGVNIDDGGTFDSPTHDIIIEGCTFRDMDASGNNDLLKLSGLDDFSVLSCTFVNGAEGGSGIDMVGCHHGTIRGNSFSNMGSNCIQCKGGSQFVRIEGNLFRNGGRRSLNLGGSTGLQYFRPSDAGFEAADLQVYSNIFFGSRAPIAYVGSVRVEVVNNTIINPDNWVIRILQETVDTNRFAPCGDNTFRNNLVYIGTTISRVTNVGRNTSPETFTFSNNLWYNALDPSWAGPDLPAADTDNIVGQMPLFVDLADDNLALRSGSPAIGAGYPVTAPRRDFTGAPFASPRSVGAIEGEAPATNAEESMHLASAKYHLTLTPHPIGSVTQIGFHLPRRSDVTLKLYSLTGRLLATLIDSTMIPGDHSIFLDTETLSLRTGAVVLVLRADEDVISKIALITPVR